MKEYKQTEIGPIPQDWEVVAVGDTLKIKHGRSQKLIVDADGEYPVLATGGKIGATNSFLYDRPSVLIGRKGTINEPQYINTPFWTIDTLYYSEIKAGYSPLFLYYKLKTIDWYRYNEASGVPSLSSNTIERIEIAVPKTVKEQQAIADLLSDMDELVEALGRKIAKKRAVKEGVMNQLLTATTRLKGFSEPWVEKELNEIGEMIGGGIDKKIVRGETPVRLVNYLDVFHKDRVYSSMLSHWVTASKDKIYKCGVRAGDIYFTPSSEVPFDIALSAVAMENVEDAGYSYHLVCFRLAEDIDLNYRAYMFKQKQFVDQAENLCEGSGKRYVISLSKFRKMTIRYPSNVKEQRAIATILTDMDNEIERLERKREKYIALKQAAMQKLLTGQIRLPLAAKEEKNTREANVHFKRSVWAAEIAHRLCEEPTFGHVKMEKLLFLTEHLCGVDIGSNYHRDAAGPYDNRAIRSIDSQLKRQNWFEAKRAEKGVRYIALHKRGGHGKYFDMYFSEVKPVFDEVINTFLKWNTERCEIVATLYSAWNDLAKSQKPYSDDDIVNEVLHNWHRSKQRIPRERWLLALGWMRKNGITPKI